MPTALKRLLLDFDDELNTDDDASTTRRRPSIESVSRPQPFAGVMFYVHGEWAGWTRGKVQRAIERHGQKIKQGDSFGNERTRATLSSGVHSGASKTLAHASGRASLQKDTKLAW